MRIPRIHDADFLDCNRPADDSSYSIFMAEALAFVKPAYGVGQIVNASPTTAVG